VTISLSFGSEAGKFFVSLSKQPDDVIIGISELADILNERQLSDIQRASSFQKFTMERGTLVKFAGENAVKELFWSGNDSAPKGDLLFFGGGTEKGGQFSYKASEAAIPQRRPAILVILDSEKRPISADKIVFIAP
jgi:hypothetical protein